MVVVILLALVIVGGLALWFAQRYVVYTEDGPQLQLPFFQEKETQPPDEPLEDIVVHVEEPVQEQEPEPSPRRLITGDVNTKVTALTFSDDGITGAFDGEIKQLDGIILNMKDDQGVVYWETKLRQAVIAPEESRLAAGEDSLLAAEGLYTVARLSCFKDHALAADWQYAVQAYNGYCWTDPEGVRWTSPASKAVQNDLIKMMVELAELGFDEILLDNCGFPNRGNLDYIQVGESYNLDMLNGVISTFLEDASAALEPYDTLLSLRCDARVISGEYVKTGITVDAINASIDRVWTSKDGTQLALPDLLETVGIGEAASRLVEITADLTQEQQYDQAQMLFPSF